MNTLELFFKKRKQEFEWEQEFVDLEYRSEFDLITLPEQNSYFDAVIETVYRDGNFASIEPRSNNKTGCTIKTVLTQFVWNFYQAWRLGREHFVSAYFDRSKFKPTDTNNNPHKINHQTFVKVYNQLAKAGFVAQRHVGYRFGERATNGKVVKFDGKKSRIKGCDQLFSLFRTIPAPIRALKETVQLIKLRADRVYTAYVKGRFKQRKTKEELAFETTDYTRAVEASLTAYNALARETTISTSTSRNGIHVYYQNGQTRQVDLTKTDLFAVFSRGSFECNGRMFGHAVQSMHKEERAKILINGQKTECLDFSAMAITTAAIQEGVTLAGDPYSITLRDGLTRDEQRAIVKKIVNTAINCQDKGKIFAASAKAIQEEYNWNTPVSITKEFVEGVLSEVISNNPWFEKYVGSDAGVRLMKFESDVARYVMDHFVMRNIIVIPVHDSFRIAADHINELAMIMRVASKQIIGQELKIDFE